ncbi:MAG TPA: GAF domain-containing protein [Candidatus Paceibacterota bacterium]
MRTAHETPGEPTPTLTPQEWLVRLDKVSGAINFASRDLANTVDLLMERLRPTLKADAIAVWSIEPGTEFLQIDAQSGLSAQYVRFFNQSDRVKLGRGIVGKAMVERSAKTMESRDDPHMLEQARWREMLVEEGVHSIMCAPMFVESNIVGALCLYYRTPRAFTEEQRLFLQVLANQLAVTIENIRNYDVISADRENLEKQLAKLFNLQRITELLDVNIGTSLESSLKALLEYLQDSFRSDSLAIFQPRSDGEMDLTVEAGLPSVLRAHLLAYPIRIDDAFIGRCFASSKEVLTSRAMTDERIRRPLATALALDGFMALGAFPLTTKGHSLGVLAIFYQDIHEFSVDEISILNLLSQFIGVSFENARTLGSLVAEKARTRAMVDSLEDGIIVYAASGEIIECNPRIEHMVGLTRPEIIGQNFTIEQRETPSSSALKHLSTILIAKNEPKESAIVMDGERIDVRITQIPFRMQETTTLGSMRVVHDITREKAVERLKSNFVTTASHQMRTPLTAIKWSVDLVASKTDALDEQQREALGMARDRVAFMIHLITDLLEESETDELQKEFVFNQEDVRPIIARVLDDLRAQAEQKNLRLEFEAPEDVPNAVVDRKKFDLAVRNLVDNAIKYTQRGSVVVRVSVGNVLEIAVEDTGIGVPRNDVHLLFNRFFRSGNAVRVVTDGSGLGLYLVKSIVERHNGTVSVHTEENRGSTFTITLPLKESMLPVSPT